MATFVPLPGGLKVTFNFTLQGVPVSVSIHVKAPGSVTQAIADQVADIARDWWELSGNALFSHDLQIKSIVATDVSQIPAYQSTLSVFTNPTGTILLESLPNGSAVVATTLTGFIGRSYRGRLFLPGFDVDAVTINELSVGAKANVEARLNGLRSNFAGAGIPWVVASYQENDVLRTVAVGTPVIGILARSYVKSQRRRNVKG
jgi:hypothetical protein